jgi:soluble P-type ATPase
MIELDNPGRGALRFQHLVLDVNGTLPVDGVFLEGVAKRIVSLQDRLIVHLVTADTHGHQSFIDQQPNLTATRLTPGNEQQQKQSFVEKLGFESVSQLDKAQTMGGCSSKPLSEFVYFRESVRQPKHFRLQIWL